MQKSQNKPKSLLKRAGRQACLICIAAAAISLVINGVRLDSLDLTGHNMPLETAVSAPQTDGPRLIELVAAFKTLQEGAAIFIDARSEYDFKAGHIKTARNLEERNLDIWMPDFFEEVPPETMLIIYCSGPRCHLAENLARRLFEIGYTNVSHMAAGWEAWQAQAYPAEHRP